MINLSPFKIPLKGLILVSSDFHLIFGNVSTGKNAVGPEIGGPDGYKA